MGPIGCLAGLIAQINSYGDYAYRIAIYSHR